MKILQRILDFYLDASIHVALSVVALLLVTCKTLNIPLDWHLCWLLFFGCIVCYNFIKYGVEAKKYFLVANQYHKNIQYISVLAFILAVYHLYFLQLEIWLAMSGFLLLTGLYALPVLPNAKNLRSWGGLKIFIVALVWAGTTVLLPWLPYEESSLRDVCIEVFQRFLLVLILLIPFEIRDLRYDDKELRTLPQRYGVANTKIIGFFLAIIFFFSSFIKEYYTQIEVTGKGIMFLASSWLMFSTRTNQSKYFASFFVESFPLVWLCVIYVLELCF